MRRVSRRPEVPMAPVQIPHILEPVQIPLVPHSPVQIPDVPESVQIPLSQLPQPPVQIPVSQVPQSPVQIPHVPEPPVQIPPLTTCADSTCPRTYADSPRARHFGLLYSTDSFDQLMSFVFGPPAQELQLLHTVPSIFDGDLISFLDEFERELAPMDLTMPRLNLCVKKSIGFKAIQPMDLSVNSCL
ncbi:hypothetical protein TNCV_365301 [Trichonephila clavipes]|nr:hypothetical protein TNCV_365301 [Trichonephila clavipes]